MRAISVVRERLVAAPADPGADGAAGARLAALQSPRLAPAAGPSATGPSDMGKLQIRSPSGVEPASMRAGKGRVGQMVFACKPGLAHCRAADGAQQSDGGNDRKFLYRPSLDILCPGPIPSTIGCADAPAERERDAARLSPPPPPMVPRGISCPGPPVKTRLSATKRGRGNRGLKNAMPQSSIQGEPI